MDLEALIESLGVSILDTHDLPSGIDGMYLHHRKIILIRSSLDTWSHRSTLAHELGHAWYGDDQHGDPRLERRADEFAAQILITPDNYRLAENAHNGCLGAIAYELGVTPRILDVWKRLYQQGRIQPESCLSSA
ncbi:ImmA/IrrE family metallo-endopeptidase [Corynebacterium ulcerans]|uniref:IrrE N-terminal-like domain-containing protein n=1 Tax=Corynebacterium ulcerans TaxID=65058 RepID=A0ABD0BEJ8_CORUL|nr:ImmA/IrrE family metallo-endopeptidase [Corynebacterium ulcerans]KPH78596.1 hypothetical protein AFK72_00855 [Corynebacterium ulcerans]MBH5303034.1 ImmA/IrrE family metallo-endopeptidase [Corynebacterium ulcerans]OIS06357.1 ImmA/IrrE family metallo-endopeptidase [Corynebacterium ulcerans]BAM26375.1 hypothetical protein CULC0102_0174 [Corynebacterium ulcerans 0102]BBJ71035.1 hypothetical protein CULC0211_01690 [Corynebacterium ulcerans]